MVESFCDAIPSCGFRMEVAANGNGLMVSEQRFQADVPGQKKSPAATRGFSNEAIREEENASFNG